MIEKLVVWIIKWLTNRLNKYDGVQHLPDGYHLHKNPVRKKMPISSLIVDTDQIKGEQNGLD